MKQIIISQGQSMIKRTILARFFSFFFLGLFVFIPILYAIIISVEAGTPAIGIEYLGKMFFEPTKNLNDISLRIINDGGVSFNSDGSFFGGIWAFIKTYWLLVMSLWLIYKWCWLFYKVSSIFNDSSRLFVNSIFGILAFVSIQILYLLLTVPDGVSKYEYITPVLYSFINFIKALPFLIKPIAEKKDAIFNVDNINNTINNLSNSSI